MAPGRPGLRAIVGSALLSFLVPAGALGTGERAPAFAAASLGAPGTTISLGEQQGRVVYVDFWASWCVPCRASMPALDALFQKHRTRGFTVVGVNKDVSADDAQRFLRRVPVTFPLVADPGDAIARQFEVKAMPSGYLIDRRGVVRQVHKGFTEETAALLAKEIERLLEEKP